MHILIHQEHNKASHLLDHPIKLTSTTYELHNVAIITLGGVPECLWIM
jgi:hypothetical protein